MTRRKTWMLIVASLSLAIMIALSGCANNDDQGKQNTTSTPAPTASATPNANDEPAPVPSLTLPLTTTGEKLSVAVVDIGGEGVSFNSGNLPVIDELEKRTGVKIEFEAVYPEYNTVMRTRIAAASGLTDIFQIPQGDDPVKIAKDGIILKLNDLIEEHAPNTKRFLDENPEVKKILTAPDGSIYAYPGQVSLAGKEFNVLALGYRLDWVKKLNLKEPETIEDWYTMLKAFKTGDPNGNNKNDEIPFVASGTGALERFAQAYGMTPMSAWFAVDDQGKVEYTWTNPKAKDYLMEMNRWWEEELIDQGMLTPHADKAMAYIVGDLAGGQSIWAQRLDQYTKQMETDFPGAEWVAAMPPKGPHGDMFYEVNPPVDGNRFVISKNAKNPELAIKWLDYMFASEEGQVLFNFGIEGLSYTLENGQPKYTDQITNNPKYPNPGTALSMLGATRLPIIIGRDALTAQSLTLMPQASMDRLQKIVPNYRPVFPNVMSTSEESASYTRLMADINTYRQEMMEKFITGIEPIDNFDKFVQNLKSMGIDDVVKIKQAQYDRWESIK